MRRPLVVLQRGLVGEPGGAERAEDGLPGVGGADVAVEGGAPGELGGALRAPVGAALGGVGLEVAGEGLLALELGAALHATEGDLEGRQIQNYILKLGNRVVVAFLPVPALWACAAPRVW